MRLYPTGCRNWGRYNERLKRPQKITSLKHGAGGKGGCFTIEKTTSNFLSYFLLEVKYLDRF